jgi:hypothetical protein
MVFSAPSSLSHKPHWAEQREVLVVPFCEANPFRASDGNVVNDTSPIFANAEVVFGSVDWGALIEARQRRRTWHPWHDGRS